MRKHLKAWPCYSLSHLLTHSVPKYVGPSELIKWASVCLWMVPYGTQLCPWCPMVPNGTWWYPMATYYTRCYPIVLDGHQWYLMVSDGYLMVSDGTKWFSMILNGTQWYQLVTNGHLSIYVGRMVKYRIGTVKFLTGYLGQKFLGA